MRIGIIADVLDRQYAGIYYYTLHLIQELAKLLEPNELYVFVGTERNDLENCTQIILGKDTLINNRAFKLFFSIPQKANKLNLDYIIEPGHFGPFNIKKSTKRITVIHDLTPLLHTEYHQLPSRLLQKLFLPSILKRARAIITNSKYTASDIKSHFKNLPAERIIPIYLGVEDIFKPTDDSLILAQYGIVKKYILYMALLNRVKIS